MIDNRREEQIGVSCLLRYFLGKQDFLRLLDDLDFELLLHLFDPLHGLLIQIFHQLLHHRLVILHHFPAPPGEGWLVPDILLLLHLRVMSIQSVQIQLVFVLEQQIVEQFLVVRVLHLQFHRLRSQLSVPDFNLMVREFHIGCVFEFILLGESLKGSHLIGFTSYFVHLILNVVEGFLDVQAQFPQLLLHGVVGLESVFGFLGFIDDLDETIDLALLDFRGRFMSIHRLVPLLECLFVLLFIIQGLPFVLDYLQSVEV